MMGILDMTDQFCNPINEKNNNNVQNNIQLESSRVHEQPIVSFVQREEWKDVLYREEL